MTSAVFSEEDVCLLYTFVLIEMTGQEFSHLTVETRRVSVNQFRREQLSYNSRQATQRDKNLLFLKIAEIIP